VSGAAIRNACMALAVCAAIVLALRFIALDFYLPAIPAILAVAGAVGMIPRNRRTQCQVLIPALLGVAAIEVLLITGIPLAPVFAFALGLSSLGTGLWLSGWRPTVAH